MSNIKLHIFYSYMYAYTNISRQGFWNIDISCLLVHVFLLRSQLFTFRNGNQFCRWKKRYCGVYFYFRPSPLSDTLGSRREKKIPPCSHGTPLNFCRASMLFFARRRRTISIDFVHTKKLLIWSHNNARQFNAITRYYMGCIWRRVDYYVTCKEIVRCKMSKHGAWSGSW